MIKNTVAEGNMGKCEYAVELEHITKRYGDYYANDDVTVRLRRGEIHALLGENGAGKSTLMNILFGLAKPDSGRILVDGKEVEIKNPNDATAYGIGMVHQHFRQVECYTVLQNIVLGAEDKGKFGILDMSSARQKVIALSEQFHFDIDPDARISDITVGMQQRVEILKMLYRDNDVLIFDEPTAVLTPQEIEELLRMMKRLADSGKSILFITHKLNEIRAIADRCSVLRKGKYIDTFNVADVTEEEMSERMVGRKVKLVLDKKPADPGEDILTIENMTVKSLTAPKNAVRGVSFSVRAGEIVCIAGIDGNGQSELVYGITGLMPIESGSIKICGNDITKCSIRERTGAGIGHVPEDRLKYGLVEDATLGDNMILQSYYSPEIQKSGIIDYGKSRQYTRNLIEEFNIAASRGPDTIAGGMSGGNQQKAVIARELSRNPSLFIASQPVRGLDVGAIEYIHTRLLDARDEGRAVLLISFELSEVMNLSDRILVMFEGEIVAELDPEKITQEELGLYMSGAKRMNIKKGDTNTDRKNYQFLKNEDRKPNFRDNRRREKK